MKKKARTSNSKSKRSKKKFQPLDFEKPEAELTARGTCTKVPKLDTDVDVRSPAPSSSCSLGSTLPCTSPSPELESVNQPPEPGWRTSLEQSTTELYSPPVQCGGEMRLSSSSVVLRSCPLMQTVPPCAEEIGKECVSHFAPRPLSSGNTEPMPAHFSCESSVAASGQETSSVSVAIGHRPNPHAQGVKAGLVRGESATSSSQPHNLIPVSSSIACRMAEEYVETTSSLTVPGSKHLGATHGLLLPGTRGTEEENFETLKKNSRSSGRHCRTKPSLVQTKIGLPKETPSSWQLNTTDITPYNQERELEVDYYPKFFRSSDARDIQNQLEQELPPFLERSRNEVKIMGKVYKIPRKQAAFGDTGLSYHFSGVTVAAHRWIPVLERIRHSLVTILGENFNFVLVNRYKDGQDHIGEHRDDERDLVSKSSIACLSFGQERDFIFKHKNFRGKDASNKPIPKNKSSLQVSLKHGSLLVMKYPTNRDWYHSLPVRKSATAPRISLTFRVMVNLTKCA